jgi:aminoglycoside phosphotransferase (APT) family kinase protein
LALQKAAPILKDFCAQLDQYNVPATLVHGDMHMSNVARTAHGYCFFDWSDACVAHPFLDMISVLHEPDSTVQQRLRDHYLAVWTAYEPWERLLAMWELAYPLCALHQAVSYRAILRNTEASCRYELAWAMPFWFGEILKSLNLVV